MDHGEQSWQPKSFVARLSRPEYNTLIGLGRREDFRDGAFLVRQGDRGRDVFVLINGRVQILFAGLEGRESRLAIRGRGDLVGEMAFMDQRPRSASGRALGTVATLRLTSEAFSRFFENHPTAYRSLAQTLTDRLRAAENRQLEGGYDVESRVAATLCQIAVTESDDVGAPLVVKRTQRDLGQLIGAATISVHRTLRNLAGRGIVETHHRTIVILDVDALGQVAKGRKTMHHLM
ncbi:CRP-like cAMP-binding protein [Asanoa ferruginea]|uniref:CRP-like cAMP-binding protein n=2 Tax=Asanoa ferruginea TaxID=53367 RepID=A0A3D9ZSG1_9ACTN|nr:CRP-like cAMP-binding protein [Asanoa ferruginea]GIF51847.1 Crp/Fnr family transcriptional regulator [Asanoa ferruginea]